MNSSKIPSISQLKIEKYEYLSENICDFSNLPRPHSCLGLILEGSAEFHINGEITHLRAGDIIFVPITSKYISYWKGTPKITYISLHFIFDSPNGLFTQNIPVLQKITPPDFKALKHDYEFILDNFNIHTDSVQLEILSRFYRIIGIVSEQLKYKSQKKIDIRLQTAREYIDTNFNKDISIEFLAKTANMSISNFHASFKKCFQTSPIEYKNKICINHAMRMLVDENNYSIEEISEQLGFSSATYFRRVFKSVTGKSPREYKKTLRGMHL